MFGLDKNKQEKQELAFELEQQLQDSKKGPEELQRLLRLAQERAQHFKNALREGLTQEEYATVSTLEKGYTALKEVLPKIVKK